MGIIVNTDTHKIYLNDAIEGSTGAEICDALDTFQFNQKDLVDKKDVTIVINCYGGVCFAASQLCDYILEHNKQDLGYKINTHVNGMVYSAAVPIWLVGYKRTITDNSEGMIHDVASGAMGKLEEMVETADSVRYIRDVMSNYITTYSLVNEKKLNQIYNKRLNQYYSGTEFRKILKTVKGQTL